MKTLKAAQSPAYAGVDISKAALDVSLAGHSAGQQNVPLRKQPGRDRAVGQRAGEVAGAGAFCWPAECEPSGGYERDLLEALWAAGLAVSLVHAARVRSFARARGLLAKTDEIDASVLREFGELLRPEARAAPSPQRQRLADLVQRREQLVNILSMEEPRRAGDAGP